MLMITNLIEPRTGKLIFYHLIGNTSPEFPNGLLDSYFLKLTLGNDCFVCFLCSNLYKLSFKPRSYMFIINGYYTKSKRLQPLGSFLDLKLKPQKCLISVSKLNPRRRWKYPGACIRSFSDPYFPAFGLNIERHGVSLRTQSECGKI